MSRILIRRILVNTISAILWIISVFLILRIGLLFIAANPATPFVSWIYKVSNNLMYPFQGIVKNSSVGGSGVFDWVALITLIVYLLFGAVIISVINYLLSPAEELDDRRYIAHRHREI